MITLYSTSLQPEMLREIYSDLLMITWRVDRIESEQCDTVQHHLSLSFTARWWFIEHFLCLNVRNTLKDFFLLCCEFDTSTYSLVNVKKPDSPILVLVLEARKIFLCLLFAKLLVTFLLLATCSLRSLSKVLNVLDWFLMNIFCEVSFQKLHLAP